MHVFEITNSEMFAEISKLKMAESRCRTTILISFSISNIGCVLASQLQIIEWNKAVRSRMEDEFCFPMLNRQK